MNKARIGIIGHGFVGKATDNGFTEVEKFIVDPNYSTSIDDLVKFGPEFCFICVPTPMGADGNQDSSILESVVREILDKIPSTIIIIKSTVLPDVLLRLASESEKVVFNPEFLREKYASEDFINAKFLIFGGKLNYCKKVSKLFHDFSSCLTNDYLYLDIQGAAMIKYIINTYLATKVTFFNEVYQLHSSIKAETTWEQMIEILSKDNRVGSSHMQVPGPDGRLGFGGACFPKDTTAFNNFAKSKNIELSVLQSAITANNKVRKKYKTLDKREKEQNVSFENE